MGGWGGGGTESYLVCRPISEIEVEDECDRKSTRRWQLQHYSATPSTSASAERACSKKMSSGSASSGAPGTISFPVLIPNLVNDPQSIDELFVVILEYVERVKESMVIMRRQIEEALVL